MKQQLKVSQAPFTGAARVVLCAAWRVRCPGTTGDGQNSPQTMEMSDDARFSGRADVTAARLSAERGTRGESVDLVQDVAALTTVWYCPLAASLAFLIVSGNHR